LRHAGLAGLAALFVAGVGLFVASPALEAKKRREMKVK